MTMDRSGAYREDGYVNLLTNYGTKRDASTGYTFQGAPLVDDVMLTEHYISNGLFAKIIDAPAERAATGEFELGVKDEDLKNMVTEALDDLDWERVGSQAITWTRLFGGSLGVMLIDDGGTLEQPLNYARIRAIPEEIVLFERPCVEPDYTRTFSLGGDGRDLRRSYRDPEFFRVTSKTGSFLVHESRCLIFKGKQLPENTAYQQYQYWGVPEYVRIRQELREAVTSHGYSVRMLERCIQAVHKMRDLAEKLSTEDGEDEVLRRMEVVDLARSLFNTIALDADGEDYTFQTYSMTGVKEILDGTCNMLSAVTQIPQTILFGRSPAGENATGDGDMEAFYGYLGTIQKVVLKPALSRLLDVILTAKRNMRIIQDIPRIKVEFSPLWKLSDTEQASLDKTKADASLVRAQAAQAYIAAQVLQPDQVYEALKKSEDFVIEDIVDDDDGDWEPPEAPPGPLTLPVGGVGPASGVNPFLPHNAATAHADDGNGYEDYPGYNEWLEEHLDATREEQKAAEEHYRRAKRKQRKDSEDVMGVGVLVLDGDKALVAKRDDGPWWGGPGGHIEPGETPEMAARRETKEEFNIEVNGLRLLGRVPYEEEFGSPYVFLCEGYDGTPVADGVEMVNQKWKTIEELRQDPDLVFPPFLKSLDMLEGSSYDR